MRRTKILNAEEVRRTTYLEAQKAFHKHCRLKNLRPRTITCYTEDLDYRAMAFRTTGAPH